MLKTRVITAVLLAMLVLGVLFYLPPVVGVGCIAALLLAGAWEWSRFAGLASPAARLGYAALALVAGALAWRLTARPEARTQLMLAAAAWWVVAFAWLALRPHLVNRAAAAVAGLCVLVPAWVGLGRLLQLPGPPSGASYLFFMLLLVWAADIGAYFAGRAWGRLPLAPQVSPKKTWEGLLGGLAAGLAVAVAGAAYYGAERVPFIALGAAVVLVSVVGDLTESMFKRYAGLKDSGSLLPGHGGVLDRIDSITSSVPFYVLGLGWLGLAQ